MLLLLDSTCSCSFCLSSSKEAHQGQRWHVNKNNHLPPIKQLQWFHHRPFIKKMPSSLGHWCIKTGVSSGMAVGSLSKQHNCHPGWKLSSLSSEHYVGIMASQLGANKHLVNAVGVGFTPRMSVSRRQANTVRHNPALARSPTLLVI